jgi:hypothetical protein
MSYTPPDTRVLIGTAENQPVLTLRPSAYPHEVPWELRLRKNHTAAVIEIQDSVGFVLCRMYRDGTSYFAEPYTPDEAAQAFWDALRIIMQSVDA